MIAKLLSTLALRLLTEKVIIKITMACADYLAKKTSNTLDDELIKAIKEALR